MKSDCTQLAFAPTGVHWRKHQQGRANAEGNHPLPNMGTPHAGTKGGLVTPVN